MVSEPSSLRPTLTEPTVIDKEPIYVSVGRSFKEIRKSVGTVSDLQKFILNHFNLPQIQLIECSNGAVAIANLFDGVPDYVESQDHESFDEINKLLCWISGSVELPERSKSVAPKVFDESPGAVEESSDQQVHDEIKASQANLGQISSKVVNLDDMLQEDDTLTDVELKTDGILTIDEKLVQIEAKMEPNLNAYHMFDEMPRRIASYRTSSDVPVLSRVGSFVPMVSEPNLPPSKYDHRKVNPRLHKLILETYLNSVACLELHYFDPGGKGFKLGGSLISDENLLVLELVDDEYDHKDTRVGSVSGHKTDFCGHFGANSKQGQAKVVQNNVKGVMFDPGGAAYLSSPFLHLTRAAILGCKVNQPDLLASEFSHAKVSFTLQKLSLVDENDMFKLLHMLTAAYFSSTCTSMNSSDRADVIKSNLLITLGENNVAAGNLDELKVKIAMPWFVWLEGGVRKEVLVFTGECFDPGGDLNLDGDPLNWKSALPKNNSGLLVKPVRSNS